MKKKFISLSLSILLVLYSLMPYGLVINVRAQEASPTATEESSPSTESSSSPSDEPTPTPLVTESPSSTPEPEITPSPEVSVSPTPTPAPTQPPYWSDEYDVWKIQKNLEDDAREVRDDEWEAHEEDEAWINAHGGNEEYYVSGQWQKDEDARKAAEAAAAAEAARIAREQEAAAAAALAASQSSDPLSGDASQALTTDGLSNNDPCASTENSGFSETGSSSTGTVDSLAQAASSTTTDVNNTNCLNLGNTGTASGISGENAQIANDGSTDMSTGGSSADGTIVNTGNVNTTDVSGGSGNAVAITGESLSTDASGEDLTQGVVAENLNTGEDTNNLAEASNNETLGVVNTNEAYVNNELNVQGTSGANVITDNDGDATLTTGDIELIANMLNILNLNITGDDFIHLIINIFGTLNGNLDIDDIASALGLKSDEELQVIARNDGTNNEGSTNAANASNTETTSINNDNTAVVNNTMNVDGVSGQNDVSGNDGNVDVVTGRIKILANLMNFINANFSGEKWSFIMINIFGKLTGDIILPDTGDYTDGASGTGAVAENINPDGGTASSQATSSETTNVTNNNDVSLTNDVNANGISGENTQNGNEGTGTTKSGEVDVLTKIMNYLNFNITGDNWVFLVVNVFGKWMGKIVNFAGKDMNAPADGSFAALSAGQSLGDTSLVQASNNGGFDNTALATNTQTTDVNNQNSAVVNNDLNINGVSGQNGLNGNDGITSLTTGWVEISANLLNIINMNVTGRNWMIVFLNVFGDFVGDLFFGAPPEVASAEAVAASARSAEADFSMGESSSSQSSDQSGTGSTVQSVVTAETSEGGSAAAVVMTRIRSNSRNKRIIQRVAVNNSQILSFSQENSYFSFFDGRVKIPSRYYYLFVEYLKRLFPQLVFKGNTLLARN